MLTRTGRERRGGIGLKGPNTFEHFPVRCDGRHPRADAVATVRADVQRVGGRMNAR